MTGELPPTVWAGLWRAVATWLRDLSPGEALGWALVQSGAQTVLCVAAGLALRHRFGQRRVSPIPPPLTTRELGMAALTTVCNAGVTWLGWWAWRSGWLVITEGGPGLMGRDAILLLMAMDLAMYVSHRLAHHPLLFERIHALHHRYAEVRPLTLFVLSPLEVGGFGALWLVVLGLLQPSWAGVVLYLLLNAAWGTMGHSGVEPLSKRVLSGSVLTGGAFHAQHHLNPRANYGFYSGIWDRLGGTLLR